MKNTSLILGSALTAMALSSCTNKEKEQKPPQPNILVILADDLGYGDLGCFGSNEIETPNIDELARQGMMMTQFYAGSAVCTPSRASILTGNSPLRYNIRQYFPRNGFLPTEAVTIPEMLKTKGYYSAHVGKWHLGGISPEHLEKRVQGEPADPGPLQHGFDHYFCMTEGDPDMPDLLSTRRLYRDGGNFLISDERHLPADGSFLTDIFTREALRLIDTLSGTGQPFFLNLWYKVPHAPYEPAPEPHYSKYVAMNLPEPPGENYHRGHNAPGDRAKYNSMVSLLDAEVGKIVQSLKDHGIFENTLIILTSDNGPSYRGTPSPWAGGKADLHEGGIRVPMIACWPGQIPEGKKSNAFAHTNDLLPTFCAAAGVSMDTTKVDGINILDELRSPGVELKRGMVFWQLDQSVDPWGNIWYPQPGEKPKPYATTVVRDGDMKLLCDSIIPKALVDVSSDTLEQDNLIGQYPDKVKEMQEGLRDFLSAPRLDCGRKASDPKSL